MVAAAWAGEHGPRHRKNGGDIRRLARQDALAPQRSSARYAPSRGHRSYPFCCLPVPACLPAVSERREVVERLDPGQEQVGATPDGHELTDL
jgi:hypothetical protein